MKKIALLLGSVIALFCVHCSREQKSTGLLQHDLMMATLFHQNAAERDALCYQAFNAAKLSLLLQLDTLPRDLKKAVVVDIDETMLDNSPFEAKTIVERSSYPVYWNEWCEKGSAADIPGAVDFLNFAVQKGVDVFYVSNRKEFLLSATMRNMDSLNFPQVKKSHFLLRAKSSSKEYRRSIISQTHQILLLIGDVLTDFDVIFEGQSIEERYRLVNNAQHEFGQRFIILPNVMYGDWEGAIYEHNYKQSDIDKYKTKMNALRTF